MNVLVTGANGNLGREVVQQLARTTTVKGAVRNIDAVEKVSQVEYTTLDYDKPETFDNALKGIDAVFLQAPPLDTTAFERMTPFINSLKEKGIKRVVLNTAFGVNYDESNPLRKLEQKLIQDGFDYTLTRPTFFIENFTTGFAAPAVTHQNVVVANAGDGKISFVSIKDIASVVKKALTDDMAIQKEFNLTGGEALSHEDAAQLLSNKLNKKVQYISLSADEMKAGALENGLPNSAADYLVNLFELAKAGHLGHVTNDVETLLGKAPRTFSEAIN